MKTIGVIGGLSWQSTVDYYRIINAAENRILGGAATGDVIVYSVNLEEMLGHVDRGELDVLGAKLGAAAQKLEQAGAALIVLATNTMHIVADRIAASVSVPFLHIVDALAQEICRRGMKKVGLLGTPFTMGLPFYREKLLREYGVEVITPPESEHAIIFDVIRNELTFNLIREESRQEYIRIMEDLALRGAEGIILGCTEIPMLIRQEDTDIPVFDTTYLHAEAAVALASQT